MNSKKKFVITISSLVAVIAIAIVAIVAVFAVSNAGVNQSLTVRYTATDISATVKANYIVGSTSTAMVTEDGENELVFRPTDTEGGSLSPEEDNIALDTKNHSIVFEYIFTNDSNSIDVAIALDTTGFSVTNMNIGYAYSYSQITDTANMPTTDSFEPMMILGEKNENGAFETLYVYVKATIANLANNASFEGNMDFALTKATPVKLAFANTSGATNSVLLQTRIIPANTNIKSLPRPIFADGKVYTWFTTDSLETMVNLPLNTDTDTTIYAGVAPYLVSVSNDGITTVENFSDEAIYVSANSGATFSFGAKDYTKSGDEYLVVNAGQTVKISGGASASNVNWATSVSYGTSNVDVLIDKPSDISTKLFYSAYGAYPQTYVGNSLNSTLSSASLTATGKSYTTDINRTATTLIEYSYNGKLYAKLENSLTASTNMEFSTGESIEDNQTYFFIVEPIVAKAYEQNADGSYTMMTLEIMGSMTFSKNNSEGNNSWQNSDLRTYLNDEFLNESGLADVVVEQSITNTDYFGTSPTSENTTDKIWLASLEDMLNWFDTSNTLEDFINSQSTVEFSKDREIPPSDMARATFVMNSSTTRYNGGMYLLRTAGTSTNYVCGVSIAGVIATNSIYYASAYEGFCPVFAINL